MNCRSVFALLPVVVLGVATASVPRKRVASSPNGGAPPGGAATAEPRRYRTRSRGARWRPVRGRSPGDVRPAGTPGSGASGGRHAAAHAPRKSPGSTPTSSSSSRATPRPTRTCSRDTSRSSWCRCRATIPASVPRPASAACGTPAFVETAKTGDFDILFLGDSITDLWNVEHDPAGQSGRQARLQEVFRRHEGRQFRRLRRHHPGRPLGPAEWRGPGPQAQGHHAHDRHQQHRQRQRPGNRRGRSARTSWNSARTSPTPKSCCWPSSPAAQPRRSQPLKIEEANKIIAKLDDQKHVFFMNINSKFLDDNGGLIGFRPQTTSTP